MNETVTVPVQVTLPVLIPATELVETTPLPEFVQSLVDSGYLNKEEGIAYLQWQTVISGLAFSLDEFVHMFRSVKQSYEQQKSGIIVPEGVSQNKKIIVP